MKNHLSARLYWPPQLASCQALTLGSEANSCVL